MKPIGPTTIPLAGAARGQPIQSPASDRDQKIIEKAAEDFESIFVMQMLKTMQSSLDGGSLFGDSNAGRVYGGLGEMELARTIAHSADFGIKQQLLDYVHQLETPHEHKPK